MKKGRYNKIQFEMFSLGYGQYSIQASYHGKQIKIHSTNSLAYDDLDSGIITRRKRACASIYSEIKSGCDY